MSQFSIVITTIYLPIVLDELSTNLRKYSREKNVEVIIIGDLKTPLETAAYVKRYSRDGFKFEYHDVDAQKQWLRRFPDLNNIIPFNTDNRRNIGYLMAYERGASCLIALDDDNYPTDADFIGGHERVGTVQSLPTVRSESGWYNVCDMLDIEGGQRIYPRGYPYKYRHLQQDLFEVRNATSKVVLNAGLWLEDPDVDAVTRLNGPVRSLGLKSKALVLDTSTNCPFNTQNTAFHRAVVPSYYYVVMGDSINGFLIDRYGDIWSSFLSKKVMDKMGDCVSFGNPLTIHKRHNHDLLKDLGQEYWGMVLSNRLVDILAGLTLTQSTYGDCYRELSLKLEECVQDSQDLPGDVKRYFKKICGNMRIWVDVCKDLGKET